LIEVKRLSMFGLEPNASEGVVWLSQPCGGGVYPVKRSRVGTGFEQIALQHPYHCKQFEGAGAGQDKECIVRQSVNLKR